MGFLEFGGEAGNCFWGPVEAEEGRWGREGGLCMVGVVYRLSSVRRMEWSDRTELWRPIWKLRTKGHKDGEMMP